MTRKNQNIPRKEEFNFFKRFLFKIITKLQKRLIKSQKINLYYKLSSLHYRLYFGRSLTEDAIDNTEEFKAAARRHGRIVIKNLYDPNINENIKVYIYKLAKRSFEKNILLNAEL